MRFAPISNNEQRRLSALMSLGLLDTPPEERFDSITKEAQEYFHVPISTISLIDKDREWFKSCQGIHDRQGRRSTSFCGHALLQKVMFIVEDTHKHQDFRDNPQVIGHPYIRFYAGLALREWSSGMYVGVFCIKDTKPRKLSQKELDKFMSLAAQAEMELNSRPTVGTD